MLLVVLALVAAACGDGAATTTTEATPEAPAPEPAPAAPAESLRIALSALEGEILDPTLGSESAKTYLTLLYDHLVGVDENSEISKEHGIAQDWDVDHQADRSVYTFHLRSGVLFHNGEELTSADVKFSLEYMMRDESVVPFSAGMREIIDSIEAPDPDTVVLTTNNPFGVMVEHLSPLLGTEGMVLSKDYIEEVGAEEFARNPVGSGPYSFLEHRPGVHIEFERVEDHWLYGAPRFSTTRFILVPEEGTRVSMLGAGDADIINISTDRVAELEGDFNVFTKQGATVVAVMYNNTWEGYLADIRVREALSIAVNREEINEFIFGGQGTLHGVIDYASYALGFRPVPAPEYDPDRAKQLIDEAVADAFPEGIAITMYLYERSSLSEGPAVGEAIASMWEELGVDITLVIEPLDYATYRGWWAEDGSPMLKNALSIRPTGNRVLYNTTMRNLYHTGGTLTGTRDPVLDQMIDDLDAELDPDEIGRRQWEIAMKTREDHRVGGILEIGQPFGANPDLITEWNLGTISLDMGLRNLIWQE